VGGERRHRGQRGGGEEAERHGHQRRSSREPVTELQQVEETGSADRWVVSQSQLLDLFELYPIVSYELSEVAVRSVGDMCGRNRRALLSPGARTLRFFVWNTHSKKNKNKKDWSRKKPRPPEANGYVSDVELQSSGEIGEVFVRLNLNETPDLLDSLLQTPDLDSWMHECI
jgi:hypothetical protein